MGKIEEVIYEKLIDPVADRSPNLFRVYKAPNGEITIHFRNLKVVLHTAEEIAEWGKGFSEALKNLRKEDYFKNDL